MLAYSRLEPYVSLAGFGEREARRAMPVLVIL
jgi:hypothetical protein